MTNQKSLLLEKTDYRDPQTSGAISLIKNADDLKQNYIVYRVKLKPIEVSVRGRDEILKSMISGKRFIQLGEYTIMVNTISSIEPLKVKNMYIRLKIDEKKKKLGMI